MPPVDYPAILAELTSPHFADVIAQAEHGEDCPADAPINDGVAGATGALETRSCTCIVGELADAVALADWLRKNVRQLLVNVSGGPTDCQGCGATIYFVRHANGKATPYTVAGLNHFADCNRADRFRR